MDLQDLLQGMHIIGVDYRNVLTFAYLSREDPAYRDLSHIIRIFETGYEHLQRGSGNDLRRRNIFYDGLEYELHIGGLFVGVSRCPALPCGGVDYGEIEGLIVGTELDEQIEHLVDDVVGAAVFAVNLIDYHYGPYFILE